MKISIGKSGFPLLSVVPDSVADSLGQDFLDRLGKSSVLQPVMDPGPGCISFPPVPPEPSLAPAFPAGIIGLHPGMKKCHLLLHIQKL